MADRKLDRDRERETVATNPNAAARVPEAGAAAGGRKKGETEKTVEHAADRNDTD